MPEPTRIAPLARLRRMETTRGSVPMHVACFAIDLWKPHAGWSDVQTLLRVDSNFSDRISFHAQV
jgi:hypothetical protein